MLNAHKFSSFISILITLSSCSRNVAATITNSINTVYTPQTTISATFTRLTSQIIPATTVQPSYTVKSFPTQTKTMTPYPSPNPERAGEIINILLQKSFNCASACFGGIVPNVTTLIEARIILNNLGLNLIDINNDNEKFVYSTSVQAKEDNMGLILSGHDGIITDISAFIPVEKQQPDVPRHWIAFSPETLIERYGEPSKMDIVLSRGPSSNSIYLNIYFDQINMIIQYAFEYKQDINRICPLIDQVYGLRIWIGNNVIYQPTGGESIENATQINLDIFSKLMTGDPNKACFNINAEISP